MPHSAHCSFPVDLLLSGGGSSCDTTFHRRLVPNRCLIRRGGSSCDATFRRRFVPGWSLALPRQIILRCHIPQTVRSQSTTCFTETGSANGLVSMHQRTLIMSLCGPLDSHSIGPPHYGGLPLLDSPGFRFL